MSRSHRAYEPMPLPLRTFPPLAPANPSSRSLICTRQHSSTPAELPCDLREKHGGATLRGYLQRRAQLLGFRHRRTVPPLIKASRHLPAPRNAMQFMYRPAVPRAALPGRTRALAANARYEGPRIRTSEWARR
eukprot:357281-Chlamydomonas_euryale.AAC.15